MKRVMTFTIVQLFFSHYALASWMSIKEAEKDHESTVVQVRSVQNNGDIQKWAGQTLELNFDKMLLKLKITHISSDTTHTCGEVVIKTPSQIATFTQASASLTECK